MIKNDFYSVTSFKIENIGIQEQFFEIIIVKVMLNWFLTI